MWMKVILTAMCTTWAVVKIRPEKKISGLYGIWTYDLCDTSITEVMASNPVQAFSFTTAQVVHITVRITLIHTTNYI